jgi:subtilisin family serine protease
MDIIRHGHDFRPAIARTPGGAVHPAATDDQLPALLGMTGIVTVGVVDTGLVLHDVTHMPHPWIGNRASCTEEERDRLEVGHRDRHQQGYLADADGHGTFVTGLILHEAQTARVIMRGVLDNDGDRANGLIDRDDVMVAKAVRELASNRNYDVKVINLSFAGGAFADEPASLREAIKAIHERVAVVAAAGNSASDEPVYPAAFEEVIAVGALDDRVPPALAEFSNCGDWVDAYAVGLKLLGPFVNFDETKAGHDTYGIREPQQFQGWARWSGTSFAAAIVSGRIAQMAIENPELSGAEAATKVLNGSPYIFGNRARWIGGANPPAGQASWT